MITTQSNGRKKSVTTADELDKLVERSVENLGPEELELLAGLEKEGNLNKFDLEDDAWKGIYHTKPVSMAQFIEDPYYLGESCTTMYPELRKDLIALFDYPYREFITTGGIGVGKCVAGDTEIYDPVSGCRTTAKEMSLSGVEAGCASYDRSEGVTRVAGCTAAPSGFKVAGDLKLKTGRSLRLSLDHPVLTPYGWKRASDVRRGDLVASARCMPPPVSPLQVSDDELIWIAYMLADGGTTPSSMTFTNMTESVLEEYEDVTRRLGRESAASKKKGVSFIRMDGKATTVSPLGMQWLRRKYDLKEKSVNKRVPSVLYGLDDRSLGIFLNRIWACDGWISRAKTNNGGGRWEAGICLGSEPFVRDIQQLLLRFGIVARIRHRVMSYTHNGEKRKSDAWSLSVMGRDVLVRFFTSVGVIKGKEDVSHRLIHEVSTSVGNPNVDITPVDREVMSRIRREIGPIPKKRYWPRPAQGSMLGNKTFKVFSANYHLPEWCRWWGDVFWDVVEDFSSSGVAEPVYDLSVPGTENFAPYGVIIHNTYGASVSICRVVYELSCMISPQKTLGLSPGTEMVIPMISKNLTLAREILKSSVDGKVRESPYFMTKFTPNIKKEYTLFPNAIRITVGSYGSDRVLGSNVYSAILDECLSNFSFISTIKHGKVSSTTVGELMAMSPEEKSDCKIVCFDHLSNEMKPGRWRIKKSTVQQLVSIGTESGAIESSRFHPILVKKGDWLVYLNAEDVKVGDFVVREKYHASQRTTPKRRSKEKNLGKCEEKDRGEEPVPRKKTLRGNAGEDAGESRKTEDRALRGNETENERIPKGEKILRGNETEDAGGRKEAVCRPRVEKKTVGAVQEGESRRESYTSPSSYDGRGPSNVWEASNRRDEKAHESEGPRARRTSSFGRVEREDLSGECSLNKGPCETVQVDGTIAMWWDGPVPDGIREDPCGTLVFGGQRGVSRWRRQDGMGGVHLGRSEQENGVRLHGDDDGRDRCDSGRESSICFLPGERACQILSDVGALQKPGVPNDPVDQQQGDAECEQWAIRHSGVCGQCHGRTSKSEADGNELKFAGVRPEKSLLSDLPPELCLSEVISTKILEEEQTYSICTEYQTLIADGFVVHNTNFPPKRKAQQIATGFGQKLKAAHFDIVEKMYRGLVRRIKSRFQEAGGGFPGMVMLASSAATTESFTERKIRESTEDAEVFVRDHTQWTVKPESEFCGEVFWVLCSTSATKSRIISDDECEMITDEWMEANDAFVMDIPIEFKDDFESNMEDALRDIAGFSTEAISQFVQRPKAILYCIDAEREHPFSEEEWVAGKKASFSWKKMTIKSMRRLPGGFTEDVWRPRRNPSALRWCHIDVSVSGDSSGFCVGHIERWVEVVRRDSEGNKHVDQAPFYVIDFMLRVNPPPAEQIYLPDLRTMLYQFQARGYRFAGFSCDTYQWVEMHQQIKRKGITPHLISMDGQTDPYDELKSAFYESRIEIYDYKPFIEEFKGLEYDRLSGKIDHPLAGCFTGETRIPLLDGSCPTISELKGLDVWVYSCMPDGTIVPGKGRGRATRRTDTLVDIVLDSGAVERCTPEHLWMLWNGTYKMAKDLSPGIDRLMPISRHWPINGGYEGISGRNAQKSSTHHMVWRSLHGEIPDGHCIHHLNHNKTDNRPSNLSSASRSDHSRRHTSERHASDAGYSMRVREGLQRFNLSDRGRAIHAESARRTAKSRTSEQYRAASEKRNFFRSDINRSSLDSARSELTANGAARFLGCGRNVIIRVMRDLGFSNWEEFLNSEEGDNHKVRHVIPVKLEDEVEVFDLEVDRFSNFALSSGVFVHNSKDVSDAVAGVTFGLREFAKRAPIQGTPNTAKGLSHEHTWVTPMILADQVDLESVKEAKAASKVDEMYMPIFFDGD